MYFQPSNFSHQATSPIQKKGKKPLMFCSLNYLLLLLAALCGPSSSLYFNFPSFPPEAQSQLILSKNSNVFRDAIQVTPDTRAASIQNAAGRAFYQDSFRLWSRRDVGGTPAPFNTTFVLNILNQTNPGGEGLAFVLSGDYKHPNNSHGKWLGLVNSTTNGTRQAAIVAVEFDTRKSYPEDIDDNHVGLDINSCYSVRQVSLSRYGVQLSTGVDVRVFVVYDGKNISVFVRSLETPVFSVAIDLKEHLPESVFVGFSGSTSSFSELNCVKSWEFNGVDIKKRSTHLWVYITFPVLALALIAMAALSLCWYRYGREEEREGAFQDLEDRIRNSTAPKKFRLRELKKATGNFSPRNKLGKGGFGTVYKGIWQNEEIAVKRVSKKSHQGKQEFVAEVLTIGNLNHKNLVKLIGWCYEKRELILVYEFMPNASLDKFIFGEEEAVAEGSTLGWETRLRIIEGVAEALDYLHNGCEARVLHRDIKASNIMLDSKFDARLGDFGLARTIQQKGKTHHSTIEIAGTPGYMAPETFLISRATVETDVYSFGVLVLEVACGRKPGSLREDNSYSNSIVHWLWELHRNGEIIAAADARLGGNFPEREMEILLILGLACCHPNPHGRPSMKMVLQVLNGEADPPSVPLERPAFVWPAMPPSFNGLDCSVASGQLTMLSELTGR